MQGMRQLALELAPAPAPTLTNFIVGDNAEVIAALRSFGAVGSERFIYLWGGTGSGRTHLLRAVVQAAHDAGRSAHVIAPGDALAGIAADELVCVDDVQRLSPPDQIELFNLFNELKDGDGALLVTGDVPPARLPLRADLLTRLASGLVYEVQVLSEAARCVAMRDYAVARGFTLPTEVLDYVLARAPRDLRTLRALIDMLDRRSLEEKRPITIPLARDLLQAAQKQ